MIVLELRVERQHEDVAEEPLRPGQAEMRQLQRLELMDGLPAPREQDLDAAALQEGHQPVAIHRLDFVVLEDIEARADVDWRRWEEERLESG